MDTAPKSSPTSYGQGLQHEGSVRLSPRSLFRKTGWQDPPVQHLRHLSNYQREVIAASLVRSYRLAEDRPLARMSGLLERDAEEVTSP